MVDGQLTAPTGNPLTVQVSSDNCSAAAGYLERNSRYSAARGEDAGKSRNGKQCVRDLKYNNLNNTGWCATWPHCDVAKCVVVKLLNFQSVLSNNSAGREYRRLLWKQSSATWKRGSGFWQISVRRFEAVTMVLFGSEGHRVWLGQLQITCG
jgi:hypothetical protein